jgi:hypothetical protein
MKRLPGTAAIVLASATLLALTGAAHAVDHGKAASDYGFANASLELYCKGILTVADAKEKAKLDRMYRNNSRWKKDYAEGYDYIAIVSGATCPVSGRSVSMQPHDKSG